MQKLSLQLACRYFADSNVFIAGSWCFGALVISLYLLTWGEKTNVLCNIYYIYTHINACFWGVVLVFWLALKSWFDFLLAAVFLMQSVFPYSAAPWPGALLGACVKADLVQEVHLARLEAEDAQPWWARGLCPSPGTPGCPGLLSASHTGAGDVLQELQEWHLRLWHEFAKFVQRICELVQNTAEFHFNP